MVAQRWICWPLPDKTCLEGGCTFCTPQDPKNAPDNKKKSEQQLRRYMKRQGMLDVELDMHTRAV